MNFLPQLLIDLVMVTGLILIVAFTLRKRHFILPLVVINLVIFSLTLVIYGQEMSIGSGLGLFAMFTLMRYRSKTLAPVEMSFLLVAICFGVINAIYPAIFSIYAVLVLESLILFSLYGMLRFCSKTKLQKIKYDKLELLKPEKHDLLINDLELRFNACVKEVTIESVSFTESYAILFVTLHKRMTVKNNMGGKLFTFTPENKIGPSINSSISSY